MPSSPRQRNLQNLIIKTIGVRGGRIPTKYWAVLLTGSSKPENPGSDQRAGRARPPASPSNAAHLDCITRTKGEVVSAGLDAFLANYLWRNLLARPPWTDRVAQASHPYKQG